MHSKRCPRYQMGDAPIAPVNWRWRSVRLHITKSGQYTAWWNRWIWCIPWRHWENTWPDWYFGSSSNYQVVERMWRNSRRGIPIHLFLWVIEMCLWQLAIWSTWKVEVCSCRGWSSHLFTSQPWTSCFTGGLGWWQIQLIASAPCRLAWVLFQTSFYSQDNCHFSADNPQASSFEGPTTSTLLTDWCVNYPVQVKGGFFLHDVFSVMVPMRKLDGKLIVWHVEINTQWNSILLISQVWSLKKWWYKTLHLRSLLEAPAFLSWAVSGSLYLGTIYPPLMAWSMWYDMQAWRLEQVDLQVSASILKSITLAASSTYCCVLNRLWMGPPDNFAQLLENSQSLPFILYDPASRRGWLVMQNVWCFTRWFWRMQTLSAMEAFFRQWSLLILLRRWQIVKINPSYLMEVRTSLLKSWSSVLLLSWLSCSQWQYVAEALWLLSNGRCMRNEWSRLWCCPSETAAMLDTLAEKHTMSARLKIWRCDYQQPSCHVCCLEHTKR